MSYYKFLIQQQSYNGINYSAVGEVVDCFQEWGIVCKEIPFKYLPNTKEVASRDWHDEHGEDVFIPSDGLRFSAYDMDVEFFYKGTKTDITANIKSFLDFLTGRNSGGSPWLAIYDEYLKIGRRGFYVQEVSSDMFFYDDVSIDALASFTVKFRVVDPVTHIILEL